MSLNYMIPLIKQTGYYGKWIGTYPNGIEQTIEIVQLEHLLIGIKVTGDDYIPAGKPTFFINLALKQARGVVSDQGYKHPFLVEGRVSVKGHDILIFEWSELGKIEFRRFNI